MKQTINFLVKWGVLSSKSVLFSIALFVFCSCSQQENLNNEYVKSLKVSDFTYIGELHNLILDNSESNFMSDSTLVNSLQTKEDAIDYIIQFNKGYIENTSLLSEAEKNKTSSILPYYKNLLKVDLVINSMAKIQDSTRSGGESDDDIDYYKDELTESDIENCAQYLNEAYSDGLFPDGAYVILNELLNLIHLNYLGLISDAYFEESIDNLILQAEEIEYEEEEVMVESVGPVLSIAKYSMDWWENNPQAMISTGKIAPWVALDTLGAVEGIVSYALTTKGKNCNVKDAAINALAGGVLTSLGGTSKLVKLIKTLK